MNGLLRSARLFFYFSHEPLGHRNFFLIDLQDLFVPLFYFIIMRKEQFSESFSINQLNGNPVFSLSFLEGGFRETGDCNDCSVILFAKCASYPLYFLYSYVAVHTLNLNMKRYICDSFRIQSADH